MNPETALIGSPAKANDSPPSAGACWSRLDTSLLVAIAIAAFLFGAWYMPVYRAGGGKPSFYQNEFGPAVMLSCGRGFVNPDVRQAPAFSAFLYQQAESLSCTDIPRTIRTTDVNGLQGTSLYLMSAAALVWRIAGVRWQALDVLMAGLFAVTVAGAYGAMRLVSGRAASLLVTLLWAISPRHLMNVPHLRDYSKAPFFVFMLIAMALAFRARRRRPLIAIGLLFGAVQGIGFGMRTDVIINFVPFFVLLFTTPSGQVRSRLTSKLACAVAALAMFVAVSLPVIRTYARNSSLWHVALLGLTSPYDENLDIGFPRPAYAFPYAHNDSYIEAVVRAYWSRLHPDDAPIVLLTPQYDRACRELFLRLAKTFPGDMITRAASSSIRAVTLSIWAPDAPVPTGITNHTLASLWETRASVLHTLLPAGLLAMAGVLLLVGTTGPRHGCVAFALFVFLTAYPVIEFEGRHFFQLEFLVFGAVAWGCTLLWRLARQAMRGEAVAAMVRSGVTSVATLAALLTIAGVTLGAARAIQIPRARSLLASYMSAPVDPLQVIVTPAAVGRSRLGVDVFGPPSAADEIQEVTIRADLVLAPCGSPASVVATFRYAEEEPALALDFSRQVPLEFGTPASPAQLFLPVYSVRRAGRLLSRFVGVDVPSGIVDCVHLSRVRNLEPLPLLIPATMTPEWGNKLYERLRVGSGLGF